MLGCLGMEKSCYWIRATAEGNRRVIESEMRRNNVADFLYQQIVKFYGCAVSESSAASSSNTAPQARSTNIYTMSSTT